MAVDNILKLQHLIKYEFKSREMISVALVHPGTGKCIRNFSKNFERLEFLGDRVWGLALADFLYNNFSADAEGDLAVRMSTMAGTEFLIALAKKTKLLDCFSIPKDFFVSDNKNSSSLADMVEAVVGAVFLDSNFETTRNIIVKLLGNDAYEVTHKTKDAKTRLQELTQTRNLELPVYRLIKMTGEAHDPIFEIEVIACKKSATGQGPSKKNAEQDAADKLMKLFTKNL
ncbi:MAG: ribonuclease III [Holosporaceae bacterium]|jgi:ribonuclease-3|nr:ribonuclease III [Holosporaceae bacterium]